MNLIAVDLILVKMLLLINFVGRLRYKLPTIEMLSYK